MLTHDAVSMRSIEMADALFDFGAGLSVRMDGDTLLHLAADAGTSDGARVWHARATQVVRDVVEPAAIQPCGLATTTATPA